VRRVENITPSVTICLEISKHQPPGNFSTCPGL